MKIGQVQKKSYHEKFPDIVGRHVRTDFHVTTFNPALYYLWPYPIQLYIILGPTQSSFILSLALPNPSLYYPWPYPIQLYIILGPNQSSFILTLALTNPALYYPLPYQNERHGAFYLQHHGG